MVRHEMEAPTEVFEEKVDPSLREAVESFELRGVNQPLEVEVILTQTDEVISDQGIEIPQVVPMIMKPTAIRRFARNEEIESITWNGVEART